MSSSEHVCQTVPHAQGGQKAGMPCGSPAALEGLIECASDSLSSLRANHHREIELCAAHELIFQNIHHIFAHLHA